VFYAALPAKERWDVSLDAFATIAIFNLKTVVETGNFATFPKEKFSTHNTAMLFITSIFF